MNSAHNDDVALLTFIEPGGLLECNGLDEFLSNAEQAGAVLDENRIIAEQLHGHRSAWFSDEPGTGYWMPAIMNSTIPDEGPANRYGKLSVPRSKSA